VAGLAGGSIVFLFLTRVLLAGQRYLEPTEFRMEGSVARVSVQIRADGVGEIVYSRDGTLRSEGARSATGEAIALGTEVVSSGTSMGLPTSSHGRRMLPVAKYRAPEKAHWFEG
jgi:hypothetical protein